MNFKLDNKRREQIALCALGGITVLALIMLLFSRVTEYSGIGQFSDGGYPLVGIAALLLSLGSLFGSGFAFSNYFVFKKDIYKRIKLGATIVLACAVVYSIVCVLLFISAYDDVSLGSLVYLALITIGYLVVIFVLSQPEISGTIQQPLTSDQIKESIASAGQTAVSISIVAACLVVLLINSAVLMFQKLYSYPQETFDFVPFSINMIFNSMYDYDFYEQLFATVYVAMMYINYIFLVIVAIKFIGNTVNFLKWAKWFAKYNVVLAFIAFAYSVSKLVIGKFFAVNAAFSTHVNLIIAFIVYVGFVFFSGRAEQQSLLKHDPKLAKKSSKQSLLPLAFLFAMTVATFSMLFVKLYSLDINAPTSTPVHQDATGLTLISNAVGSFQSVLAVVLISFLVVSSLLFVLTILNYIVDSENYKQAALNSAYFNLIFQVMFFIAGLVFVIMVPSFNMLLKAIFGDIADAFLGDDFNISEYVISETYSHIPLILGFITVILMQIFCFGIKGKSPLKVKSREGVAKQTPALQGGQAELSPTRSAHPLFDPCPAFSEIDRNFSEGRAKFKAPSPVPFENLTLERLTEFVVEFARNTPERLSYSKERIATFIAGMGAARLSVLQGLSGTGKTSLPKVFMKAIGGECNMVEIESSWRDKNELLGYYNEFSKIYTPRKFTQYLYNAKLNDEIPTFIVLDEMNLSRIEYYFSDFLSLMEESENERVIKLLNVQIFPCINEEQEDGEIIKDSYLGLENGHSLHIPPNVWFVGTANRDESTFEISDKVYDRALTMNFNSRAPKIMSPIKEVPPRFVNYNQLSSLFEEAKQLEFNAETHPLVCAIEKVLEPYEITFGNRSLCQIEDFVKIYLKCNDISTSEKYNYALNTAIENVLLTKAVRKLELKIIDNKEQLIEEFERINCKRIAAFVGGLVDS